MNYGTLSQSDAYRKDEYSGLLAPKGRTEDSYQGSNTITMKQRHAAYFVSGAALSALVVLLLTRKK